jgi:hypothetical protein
LAEYCACVVPSIVRASLIGGNALVGRIVWTPPPEILNWIVSAPPRRFDLSIASRNEFGTVAPFVEGKARRDGRATLRMGQPAGGVDSPPTDVVRVSPRVRTESLADNAIPTLRPGAIEPFLAEPIIGSEGVPEAAPS